MMKKKIILAVTAVLMMGAGVAMADVNNCIQCCKNASWYASNNSGVEGRCESVCENTKNYFTTDTAKTPGSEGESSPPNGGPSCSVNN